LVLGIWDFGMWIEKYEMRNDDWVYLSYWLPTLCSMPFQMCNVRWGM